MKIETSFVSGVTNLPEFEDLLLDYDKDVLLIAEAAGLPKLAPQDFVASSIDHLDEMLPPNGRLALARGAEGRLVGCGTLRRIRPAATAVEPRCRRQDPS